MAATDNAAPATAHDPLFIESERCIACHSNISTSSGEDISIGYQWRGTMMANSARDPYWLAGVRREVIDHPAAQSAIEDKCTVCHMPMGRTQAVAQGGQGKAFATIELARQDPAAAHLAMDGVSCTLCHQITAQGLGEATSFDGGYHIDLAADAAGRPLFGPYTVDSGRQRAMHSSTERFRPVMSTHVRQSELCATCHTLYTQALDANGQPAGELPEQMPYQEWLASSYARDSADGRLRAQSCQSCHMPVVAGVAPITSTLGQPHTGVARHVFVGGNAYMLRLLNRYREELGVVSPATELQASVERTQRFLRDATARLTIESVSTAGGQLEFELQIMNLAGHKFPTAYPSRRAWLHVQVSDTDGRIVFESGALQADGSIAGNDNDQDADRFEPHYTLITAPDQVQIYESIMQDARGQVTTGLLSAVRYAKDNRLLPAGFDKTAADPDVAVRGAAATDADFIAGGDRVRYRVALTGATAPLTIRAELLFQSIGHRWAQNLQKYDAAEPRRMLAYYAATAADSAETIASVEHRMESDGQR
jgi:hypothetical protein